jgi:hypothetical protein
MNNLIISISAKGFEATTTVCKDHLAELLKIPEIEVVIMGKVDYEHSSCMFFTLQKIFQYVE